MMTNLKPIWVSNSLRRGEPEASTIRGAFDCVESVEFVEGFEGFIRR